MPTIYVRNGDLWHRRFVVTCLDEVELGCKAQPKTVSGSSTAVAEPDRGGAFDMVVDQGNSHPRRCSRFHAYLSAPDAQTGIKQAIHMI
jgi:hypothetical protein